MSDGAANVGEVMRKLGRAIGEAISPVCVAQFGRRPTVFVGGYANSNLDESAAPFVWISQDALDGEVGMTAINSFSLRAVIGLVPRKDAPSPDRLVQATSAADTRLAAVQRLCEDAYDDLLVERIHELALAAKENVNEAAGFVGALYHAAKAAETAEVIAAGEALYEKIVASRNILTELIAVLSPLEDVRAAEWLQRATALLLEHDQARQEFHAALQDYRERAAATEEQTYIEREEQALTPDTDGLVVYGATTIFDSIRQLAVEAVRNSLCGVPVNTIQTANDTVSHFPLDWTTLVISFGGAPSLNG